MLGQPGGEVLPHRVRIDLGRRHVGQQAVVPDGHSRLSNPRVAGQDGLDLAGLDPEPTELHLIIGTPGEHQLTAARQTGQVSCPVHPLTGGERIGDEPLRRQRRTAQVATGQPDPRHVQLADDSRRQGPKERVQ